LDKPQHKLFAGIKPVKRIIDIGPGIKPVRFFEPELHICVEPSPVYAKILKDNGYNVVNATAIDALKVLDAVDSIFMLDVIEHMEKEEGFEVIELAKKKALSQVIIFTPNGFLDQTTDEWGYGQTEWQTHRSGWYVGDFPEFKIRTDGRSIFGLYTRN